MTQILIHRAAEGIVLATDSRAVVFSDEREEESEHLTVLKVFHPLPNVVMVTGGAGYGQWLCESFQGYLVEHRLDDVSEAADKALSFLSPLVEALRKKHPQSVDRPHLDRFYIVVAGVHHAPSGQPSVDVRLFASDQASEPLHAVEVQQVVTIPRQVTLEYRLSRMGEQDATLDAVEKLFESFLCNAAEVDEDVGPPFHFIQVRPSGIRLRTSSGRGRGSLTPD